MLPLLFLQMWFAAAHHEPTDARGKCSGVAYEIVRGDGTWHSVGTWYLEDHSDIRDKLMLTMLLAAPCP
jgi:hypothetical protein